MLVGEVPKTPLFCIFQCRLCVPAGRFLSDDTFRVIENLHKVRCRFCQRSVLLLLRGQVAPPQLVLADPSRCFFTICKAEQHRGERDFGMLLNGLITIVAVNKGITPDDQRRNQLALFEDIFFKLLKFIIGQRGNLGLELRGSFLRRISG